MVMLKLGPPLIAISGKCSGEAYRLDPYGIHWHTLPARKHRKPSTNQRLRRNAFRRLIFLWLNELTAEQTSDWCRWSDTHPKKNKIGETIFWTGFNWFVHFNINRLMEDISPVLDAPWEWG